MCHRANLVWAVALLAASCAPSVACAQFFFESDAVALTRNSDGGAPFVAGPNSVSTEPGGYGWEPGYRLGFGWMGEDLQVDTTFTQISPWTSSSSGTFGGNLYFDQGDPALGAADSALVFPGFLNTAAASTLGGATQEGFLPSAGSKFSTATTSNYRDVEINIGSSQYKRPWRFGVGYRNIQLDEKNIMNLSGAFDTTGTGISDAALMNAGAQYVSGAGVGFDQTTPTTFLAYQVNGHAQNEMNGAQAFFGYRIYDGSWFTIEGTGKAGIYHNAISGRVQESLAASGFDNSVYQRTLTSKDAAAAFAGNLGLRAVVGITDYIDLTLGYEILFLSGVGLGPDQLNGVRTDSLGATAYHVQHNGSLIANGGTIGLRIYW